jgi:hypothetical protein
MNSREIYSARVLCVGLPDMSLKVVEHALTKTDSVAQISLDPSDAVQKIAGLYFDVVIIDASSSALCDQLKEITERYASIPILDITEFAGHHQIGAEIDRILIDEIGPNWKFFESAFPDDPNVVSSLRVELKKELEYFGEGFHHAFEKGDKAALRDAIHRIEVVCEQLRLKAFLRLFYYLRKIDIFREAEYLKVHTGKLIANITSRL